MFTGIIEEVGNVERLTNSSTSCRLTINASKVLEGTKIGDSICVNGVCLTVVRIDARSFDADVMPETLSRSSLGSLSRGSIVNLERALTLNTRIGGHIVSGHIDTTCRIISITKVGNAKVMRISIPEHLSRYIVEKGSIAVEGVSLTVSNVGDDWFEVSLIPHSFENTDLNEKEIGMFVNLECDVLAKYVEKIASIDAGSRADAKESKLTEAFLFENGF